MKRTVFPPNCEVCDSNPSRLLAFVAKQRRVFAEYGFWLSAPLRTQEERDGHRRYMRDWHRRYRAEHIDKLRAYRHDYWQTVTKRGFECKAEAVGDEEKLKRRAERKAAEKKRAELEVRRNEVHAKYGFWLGRKPATPDEIAGRERYRHDRDAAYKETHKERQQEYRRQRSERDKARKEQRFQEKYLALKADNPDAAESMRRKHETLCRIQNMTHEERVRYRQQRQFDKLKAQAEREEKRKRAIAKAREERKAIQRAKAMERKAIQRAKAAERKAKKRAEKHMPRQQWLAMAAVRRTEREALEEADRLLAETYRMQREANRLAYLEIRANKAEALSVPDSEPTDVVEPPEPPADNVEDSPGEDHEESTHVSGGVPPVDPPTGPGGGRNCWDDGDDDEADPDESAEEHEQEPELEQEAVPQGQDEKKRAKEERKALLEQAREIFAYKVRAYENKKFRMRRTMKLPQKKRDWTQEQRDLWNAYLRESRAQLNDWLLQRIRREIAEASRTAKRKGRLQTAAEDLKVRAAREKAREERRRLVLEKYGFTLGKKPVTPEEVEGRKRYDRDMEAEKRKRNHDRIAEYNREYRRRTRRQALERAQEKWSPEQWAAWEKREAARQCPAGSPQWLVREVVQYLAREQSMDENLVMERLIQLGGLDFLLAGAESMGKHRCSGKGAILAAVRALALYLDPDQAAMFGGQNA